MWTRHEEEDGMPVSQTLDRIDVPSLTIRSRGLPGTWKGHQVSLLPGNRSGPSLELTPLLGLLPLLLLGIMPSKSSFVRLIFQCR